MILYNVTVKIDPEVQADWLQWMSEVHIPDVLRTGYFTESKLCRLLEQDEADGVTYAVQYLCPSLEALQAYQQQAGPALRRAHSERYQGRFVAFRTLLHVEQITRAVSAN